MRTIKFRGKKIENGEWLYGDLVQDDRDCYYIYPKECGGLYANNKVDTETIGQFTGLLDKNGKEIFEGDILEIKDEGVVFTKVVGFNNGMFGAGDYTLAFYGEDNIEIIGNIHDNPELLKDE